MPHGAIRPSFASFVMSFQSSAQGGLGPQGAIRVIRVIRDEQLGSWHTVPSWREAVRCHAIPRRIASIILSAKKSTSSSVLYTFGVTRSPLNSA